MTGASSAGVSSRVKILFYNAAQTQISEEEVSYSASTLQQSHIFARLVTAPPNAKFYKLELTGGIPNVGTSAGTIYFDGISAQDAPQTLSPHRVTIYYAGSYTHELNERTTRAIILASSGGGEGQVLNSSIGADGGDGAMALGYLRGVPDSAVTLVLTVGAGGDDSVEPGMDGGNTTIVIDGRTHLDIDGGVGGGVGGPGADGTVLTNLLGAMTAAQIGPLNPVKEDLSAMVLGFTPYASQGGPGLQSVLDEGNPGQSGYVVIAEIG
jgi:hypothetical protein